MSTEQERENCTKQIEYWANEYERIFSPIDDGSVAAVTERRSKLEKLKRIVEAWDLKINTLKEIVASMERSLILCFVVGLPMICVADTVVVSNDPSVVRNAAIREAIRQDSTWTSENIQKNPYLFLQDQLRNCDKLKDKIDAQNITLVRMEKEAERKSADAASLIKRYTKFLDAAKVAYKAAEDEDSWPATVNGYEMDEEELSDKIADALERVELAKKDKKSNEAIGKKIGIRKGVLKTKKRELISLRRKLNQQAEQVKMNAALAEIGALEEVLGTVHDLMLEIDEDPAKLSVDDLTAEDPNEKRDSKVRAFLAK